jgi:hydroxymethylglutaryl-CoA lyase
MPGQKMHRRLAPDGRRGEGRRHMQDAVEARERKMSDLPNTVTIYEVGPREGFQFEKRFIPTERKLELVTALSRTGVKDIEVTSFVHPEWVPQMADAEAVSAGLPEVPGLRYSCLYLNTKGLERAARTGRYHIDGSLKLGASPAFIKKNTNKTIEEHIATFGSWIDCYEALGVPVEQATVNAAWGCNYQGDIPQEWVLSRIGAIEKAINERGYTLKRLLLSDTMGWGNPVQTKRLLGAVRDRWPDAQIRIHLHDTRGPGLANIVAALELGITHFDAAVAGLGGCPFAGHAAAAGNICTEDLVFMCEEMGIDTGIDLEALIECARLAQEIVGHPLPGKAMNGGSLAQYRQAAAS